MHGNATTTESLSLLGPPTIAASYAPSPWGHLPSLQDSATARTPSEHRQKDDGDEVGDLLFEDAFNVHSTGTEAWEGLVDEPLDLEGDSLLSLDRVAFSPRRESLASELDGRWARELPMNRPMPTSRFERKRIGGFAYGPAEASGTIGFNKRLGYLSSRWYWRDYMGSG